MTALTCKICERTLEIPNGAREVLRRFGIVTYLFPNREAHVFRIVKETAPAIKPVAPIKPTVPVIVPVIVPVPVLEQPKQRKPTDQPMQQEAFDKFGATLADAFNNFKK